MSSKSLVLFLSLLLLATVPALADSTLYDNGPINGSVDAWTVNFGYAVTDSFTLYSSSTITGFQFGVWAYPGDTAVSVDYSIDSSPFGGTPTTVALSSSFQYSNQYGYDLDLLSAGGLYLPLNSGTYWLTLQNAVTTQGNPLYWDENSGPSSACESALGTIPSESFRMIGMSSSTITCGVGNNGPACGPPTPEPGTFVLLGSGLLSLGAWWRRKV